MTFNYTNSEVSKVSVSENYNDFAHLDVKSYDFVSG